MSDAILNKFVASGTAAERAAFTPDPPTPAAGPDHGYLWFETDTDSLYAWDESLSTPDWVLISTGGGGISQLTGDVTAGPGTGSQAATIPNDTVTNAKAANMAQSTIKGRAAGAGTGDPTDLTPDQASAVLDGASDPFVRTSAAGGGNVSGPGGSPATTDNAVPRWNGTTGDQLDDTGVTIDDNDILTANGVHIPLHDAGNSGTSKTINWNDGNEQLCTLTGNVTFTLSNPRDGGRYVLVLASGAGGFTVTWPAAVKWPDGSAPTITATASRYDLITLMYLSGAAIYLASINQNYSA